MYLTCYIGYSARMKGHWRFTSGNLLVLFQPQQGWNTFVFLNSILFKNDTFAFLDRNLFTNVDVEIC